MANNLTKFIVLVVTLTLAACVELPEEPTELKTSWLEQGWSNFERHWYHHANQGTNTFGVPYEWLAALEQPRLSIGDPGLLLDQTYLARMGFIPSPKSAAKPDGAYGYVKDERTSKFDGYDWNSANLPVGFSVGGDWINLGTNKKLSIPGTGRNATRVGLTCAACHTGQLEYAGHRLLIDGGQSMISLDKFRESFRLSMGFTKYVPGRFSRFAKRVLKDNYNDANQDALEAQFSSFMAGGKVVGQLEDSVAEDSVPEGFTRLDALNRIGNQVFSLSTKNKGGGNFHATSAPVSFPHIWTAPWFDWVQYNSSIQQPMVRNLGEALGVSAPINLIREGEELYKSSIPGIAIFEMEELLAGKEHPLTAKKFGGLQAPKWTTPLPALNFDAVERGRKLYMEEPTKWGKGLCVDCHLPPVSPDSAIFEAKYWQTPGDDHEDHYLVLETTPVIGMGTDCAAAYDMAYRNVTTDAFLGVQSGIVTVKQGTDACPIPADPEPVGADKVLTNFGVALGDVVNFTKNYWYDSEGFSDERRYELDGRRPDGIRATVGDLPVYKARPLNGIWATAPFLHNGSIPNMYLLLSPQAERDKEASVFYLGNRQFDAKYLGFAYREKTRSAVLQDAVVLTDTTGLFELDTNNHGDRNTGHLFTDDEKAPGRLGRELSAQERMDLIEFLKSL